jgi:hypothetical protein
MFDNYLEILLIFSSIFESILFYRVTSIGGDLLGNPKTWKNKGECSKSHKKWIIIEITEVRVGSDLLDNQMRFNYNHGGHRPPSFNY